MKIEGHQIPKSSFLSIEKDAAIIINNLMKNERLKRLLYYTTPDALDRPNISDVETIGLIKNNIKLIPKIKVDNSVLNYIEISFDNFIETENPEFKDNIVEFDILCHHDQWMMKDFALRPYKIAGEIDSMLNKKRLTGIGTVQFYTATKLLTDDDYSGVCLMYRVTHGEEDKKFMPNPRDEERFLQDFYTRINAE